MRTHDLDLQQLEPDNENIKKVEVSYRGGYAANYVSFKIKDSYITCSNKTEIREALVRRGEKYFDDVTTYSNCVCLEMDVSKTLLTDHVLPKHIIKARDKSKTAFKNTVDDVFGVGCVEVE